MRIPNLRSWFGVLMLMTPILSKIFLWILVSLMRNSKFILFKIWYVPLLNFLLDFMRFIILLNSFANWRESLYIWRNITVNQRMIDTVRKVLYLNILLLNILVWNRNSYDTIFGDAKSFFTLGDHYKIEKEI